METLIYCTKHGPFLTKRDGDYELDEKRKPGTKYLNGTICGICNIAKAEEISRNFVTDYGDDGYNSYSTKTLESSALRRKSCLLNLDIEDYVGWKEGWAYFTGEVQEFGPYTPDEMTGSNQLYDDDYGMVEIKSMPQSYCYAYRWDIKTSDGENFQSWTKKILILAVRPKHVRHMLQKLKTVEIRKTKITGGDITYE